MSRHSDIAELGRIMREQSKERAERNLAAADSKGWTQHTAYHWSRTFNGARLDYWPSRNRFQYGGKVMSGDVNAWMRKRAK